MGGEDRCKQGLVGKPDGKRPQIRPRHRSGYKIQIHRQEVGWGEGMDWNDLSQYRGRWWAFVNTVMNLQDPLNVGSFLTS